LPIGIEPDDPSEGDFQITGSGSRAGSWYANPNSTHNRTDIGGVKGLPADFPGEVIFEVIWQQ
jgi:hypothetical protein